MRTSSCVALLAALALMACAKDKDEESAASRVVTGAKTVIVAEQPFVETLDATAVVSARPDHLAMLSAPSAARVAAVHVVAGQRVAKGDVLVELDQVAFRGAVNTADAALAAAEKQAARQQRLADAGIAARRDVDLAQAELASARAAAETAHRQADLSIIRAPIAGIVTAVTAVLGATADPAQALVQVADGGVVDLTMNLVPADAARLRVGAAVVVLGEGKNAAAIGEGTLTAVGAAVDSATRAVTVRASVRRSARALQVGETVPVRVTVAARDKAIVVPIAALVPDGESFKVFVVDGQGIAHARAVEVNGRSDTQAEIVKGLKSGERIVTYGAYGMDDSVKVVPEESAVAKPAGAAAGASKAARPDKQ